MKDPFFIAPVPWLSEASRPLANMLGLPTLPLHIHEVILAAAFYSIIYYPISPILSSLLFSSSYNGLSIKKKRNWHAHVVSLVQSTLINGLAIWVMLVDKERRAMSWEERIWGYTGAAGMVQAFAAGYFVWDLVVTSSNLDVFGLGTLAHAVAALAVYMLGFVSWTVEPPHGCSGTNATFPETFSQLLRLCLHPLGAFDAVLECPLVLRQTRDDRFQATAL